MQVTVKIDFGSGDIEENLRIEYAQREYGGSYSDAEDDGWPTKEDLAYAYLSAVLADPESSVVGSDLISDWEFVTGNSSSSRSVPNSVVNATTAQLDFHNRQHGGNYNDCKMLH